MSSAWLVLILQVLLLVGAYANDPQHLQSSTDIYQDAEKTDGRSSHLRRTALGNRILGNETDSTGYQLMSSPPQLPAKDERQLHPSKSSKKSSKKGKSKGKKKSPNHKSKSKHGSSKDGPKSPKSRGSKTSKKSSKSKSSKSSKKSPSEKVKGGPKSHASDKHKGSPKTSSGLHKSGKKGAPQSPKSAPVDVENDAPTDAGQSIESSNITASSSTSLSSNGDEVSSHESSSSSSSSGDIRSEDSEIHDTTAQLNEATASPSESQQMLDDDPVAASSKASSSLASFGIVQVQQDILPMTLENAFSVPEVGEASSPKIKPEAAETSPTTKEEGGDGDRKL